jgi:hypothetical protein
MRHVNPDNWPTLPAPDGWLMGVVMIGAGVTLWWLTPDMLRSREERSRDVWGDRSPWERHPESTRAYVDTSWRLWSVLMIIVGIGILVVQIALL